MLVVSVVQRINFCLIAQFGHFICVLEKENKTKRNAFIQQFNDIS